MFAFTDVLVGHYCSVLLSSLKYFVFLVVPGYGCTCSGVTILIHSSCKITALTESIGRVEGVAARDGAGVRTSNEHGNLPPASLAKKVWLVCI